MPLNSTRIRVGHVAGIAVDLDWSLLIIFALITGALAMGLFPAWHPEWPVALRWGAALAAAALFLASVLAHELAHALVGRRRGISIRQITLFVFGGMAHMDDEPRDWRDEFWMAIAGPAASLLIGVACLFIAATLIGPIDIDPERPQDFLSALGVLPSVLLWLGQINIILGIFNLVPGFPLDGGRVLRALLWGATGDMRRATRHASTAGQLFAWLLIGTGVAMALGVQVPVFGSGLIGGLWLMFIGWFLNNAAVMSYRQLLTRDALDAVPVSKLMRAAPAGVDAGASVRELVDDYLLNSDQRAFPVLDDGRLVGLVSLQDVRPLPQSNWPHVRVAEVMTARDRLVTVAPGDDAFEVLGLLGRHGVNQVPVIDAQGRVVGLVRREDILRWLTLFGDGGPVRGRISGQR